MTKWFRTRKISFVLCIWYEERHLLSNDKTFSCIFVTKFISLKMAPQINGTWKFTLPEKTHVCRAVLPALFAQLAAHLNKRIFWLSHFGFFIFRDLQWWSFLSCHSWVLARLATSVKIPRLSGLHLLLSLRVKRLALAVCLSHLRTISLSWRKSRTILLWYLERITPISTWRMMQLEKM